MPEKIIIGYWGIRGRASSIKHLLEYLQMPYDFKPYIQKEEWFQKDKLTYQNDPLANLPYLKDGNTMVFESSAIPVYIANKAKRPDLLGNDPKSVMYNMQALSLVSDVGQVMLPIFMQPNKEDIEGEKGKAIFQEQVVPLLKKIDKFLLGRKFAAGNNITVSDFALLELEDLVRIYDQEVFNGLTNIYLHLNNVCEQTGVKVYRQSNRFSERPFFPSW